MSLKLMYITNRVDVALVAEKYGVDRIWVDLETLGKELRQKNFDSVKSHHSIDDIKAIKPKLTKTEMLVRVNPWNAGSGDEINAVIESGADIVMLPMWTSAAEAEAFIKAVNKRAKTILLLETRGAEECLDEVLKIPGIDEIHIGLNDLHIQYGMKFMFELLANGKVDEITKKISEAGIPFGFGGVGRIGEGTLPAERIITEHYRLKSQMVILSRSFCNTELLPDITDIEKVFSENMKNLREFEKRAALFDAAEYADNHVEVGNCIKNILERING